MRHNPIDQVYAEIVAARERKVTLIIEAIKNLRRSIESKQAQIDKHQAKVLRPRCPEPCGKLRYTLSKSAMRANKHNDKSIRPYYDTRCHIWHVTKGE